MNKSELIALSTVLHLSGVGNSTTEIKWFSCFLQCSLSFTMGSPSKALFYILWSFLFPCWFSYHVWAFEDRGVFCSGSLSILAYTHLLYVSFLFWRCFRLFPLSEGARWCTRLLHQFLPRPRCLCQGFLCIQDT